MGKKNKKKTPEQKAQQPAILKRKLAYQSEKLAAERLQFEKDKSAAAEAQAAAAKAQAESVRQSRLGFFKIAWF
jgi:hypothetical protein